MKHILEDLGHKVNTSKSKICFSSNTCMHDRLQISSMLGFAQIEDLGVYLGIPLFHSRSRKVCFNSLWIMCSSG